jgi:hypothetical protein
MTRTTLSLFAALAIATFGARTSADTINGTTGNDTIYVGLNGGKVKVCINGNTPLTEIESGTSLTENHVFNLDEGNDEIRIMASSDSNITACGVTLTGGISFGSFAIDVNGEEGDDRILGADNRGLLLGGDDNDRVTVRDGTTGGVSGAGGGLDDDTVCAGDTNYAVGTATLQGNEGVDCLEVVNLASNPSTFNCGAGTDFFVDIAGYGETSCEDNNDNVSCGAGDHAAAGGAACYQ